MNSIPSRRNTSAITSLPHSSLTVSSGVGRSISHVVKVHGSPSLNGRSSQPWLRTRALVSGGAHDVSVFVQPKRRLLRGFEDLWMPRDAAGVGPAEHREQHAGLVAGVAKAAHHAGWHRDDVQRIEDDLVLGVVAPENRPLTRKSHENFDRGMIVQGGAFTRFSADESQIEVFDRSDSRRERRVLGHARPDHIENLALAARNQAVDKRLAAGSEFLEPRRALARFLFGYLANTQSRQRFLCRIFGRSHFIVLPCVLISFCYRHCRS